MVKKILSFFYTDLQWKLISLALAVVVWFFAMNMHDPPVNDTFSNPLQLVNERVLDRYNLVLLNRNELLETPFNIGVRALSSYFTNLTIEERADFYPFVDLSAIDTAGALEADEPVTQILSVNPNLRYGFELWFIRNAHGSASVEVHLDRLISRSFVVEPDAVGQVMDGFELRSIQAVNQNVTVSGARTHVNRVAFVGFEVDLANIDTDTDFSEVPLVVFDMFGEAMTEYVRLGYVWLGVRETTVNVQVLPVRRVGIRIEPIGQVAPDFALASMDSPVLYVDVVGAADILDETEYILLEFDLDGLTEDSERQLAIADFLPAGLELSNNAPEEITVSVVIEPISRRVLFVPGRYIITRGVGVLADPVDPVVNVRVVVSGPQSRVSAMTVHDIGIEMDLNNLPIGVHRVPLTAALPEGVSLAEPLHALYMNIHLPARDEPVVPEDPLPETTPTPTPIPTPTPTPTPTPSPGENGNGYEENGNGEYPPEYPGYPENGEDYPYDDPYNDYYYDG